MALMGRVNDAQGRYMIQEPRTSWARATWLAVKELVGGMMMDLRGALHAYRRLRRIPLPYHAKIAPGDPVLNRLESMEREETGDRLGVVEAPDGTPTLELYRDEEGGYFTPSMITSGKFIPKGRMVFALEMTAFHAQRMLQQLDVIRMEVDLTENEKVLYSVCKKMLDDQHLGAVETDDQSV